jgi:hypothetical protein
MWATRQLSALLRLEGIFTTVHDKKKHESRTSVWEQVITVAVTLIAALFAVAIGAPDKWLTAIFVTVVTFGGMISFFKGRWLSKKFWEIIAGAVGVHLVLAWLVFGVVLRQMTDVGLLVCLPGILVECFILYHAVRFLAGESEGRVP